MLDENRNINPSKMSSLSIYKEYVGLLFTHIYCNYQRCKFEYSEEFLYGILDHVSVGLLCEYITNLI